jgi:hypothetical protein
MAMDAEERAGRLASTCGLRSIDCGLSQTNKPSLWVSLRRNIETFMNGLLRAGALRGEKDTDAYFVRHDRYTGSISVAWRAILLARQRRA